MLESENFYHVFNQGNNKSPVFFDRANYSYFLEKVKKYIFPYSEIVAYCLMPNHFHFLIYTNDLSLGIEKVGSLEIPKIRNGFRKLLSYYAQAINKQQKRTGSLFRQKTKFKLLPYGDHSYPFICFNYIHQNPLKAGLVEKIEDWEFSSFNAYTGLRDDTLCNKKLAAELLDLNFDRFYEESYGAIDPRLIKGIW